MIVQIAVTKTHPKVTRRTAVTGPSSSARIKGQLQVCELKDGSEGGIAEAMSDPTYEQLQVDKCGEEVTTASDPTYMEVEPARQRKTNSVELNENEAYGIHR